MEPDEKVQRRKNLLVGWSIGIIAIGLYLAAIFMGAGKGG